MTSKIPQFNPDNQPLNLQGPSYEVVGGKGIFGGAKLIVKDNEGINTLFEVAIKRDVSKFEKLFLDKKEWVKVKVGDKKVYVNVNSLAERAFIDKNKISKKDVGKELYSAQKRYDSLTSEFSGTQKAAVVKIFAQKRAEIVKNTSNDEIQKTEVDILGKKVTFIYLGKEGIYLDTSTVLGSGGFKTGTIGKDFFTGEKVALLNTDYLKYAEKKKDSGAMSPVQELSKREAGFLEELKDVEGVVKLRTVAYEDQKGQFLALDLASKGDLFDGLGFDKSKPPIVVNNEQRAQIGGDFLGAIKGTHAKGIVHRDLKTKNILLTEVDGKLRGKLADFGLAAKTLNDVANLNELVGTPGWISPERWNEVKDHDPIKAEIFEVALVLWSIENPTDDRAWLRPGTAQESDEFVQTVTDNVSRRTKEVENKLKEGILSPKKAAYQKKLLEALNGDPAKRPTIDDLITANKEYLQEAKFEQQLREDPAFAAVDLKTHKDTDILKNSGEYLIRESSQEGHFVLAVFDGKNVQEFSLYPTHDGYQIQYNGKNYQASDLTTLLTNFKQELIRDKSINSTVELKPVSIGSKEKANQIISQHPSWRNVSSETWANFSLKYAPPGAYIIRPSKNSQSYTVSYKGKEGGVKHVSFNITPEGKFSKENFDQKFNDLSELIKSLDPKLKFTPAQENVNKIQKLKAGVENHQNFRLVDSQAYVSNEGELPESGYAITPQSSSTTPNTYTLVYKPKNKKGLNFIEFHITSDGIVDSASKPYTSIESFIKDKIK